MASFGDVSLSGFPFRRTTPASACGHVVVTCVLQKPYARGENGIAHDVRQPVHGLRNAEAHRNVEHFFGQLDGAFHLGAAAGEHDARRDHFFEAAAAKLFAHEAEQLLDPLRREARVGRDLVVRRVALQLLRELPARALRTPNLLGHVHR